MQFVLKVRGRGEENCIQRKDSSVRENNRNFLHTLKKKKRSMLVSLLPALGSRAVRVYGSS